MPDAIRFCFDVVAQGSALDGAALDIVEIPGRARCLDCGSGCVLADMLSDAAAAARASLNGLRGEELNIKSMELEAV